MSDGDLNLLHAKEYCAKKKAAQSGIRCDMCWLDRKELCICAKLPQIAFNSHFRFVIYQDFKEYLNPGDDGKLLLCTSPEQTHLILYPFEDQKLLDLLQSPYSGSSSGSGKRSDVCVLFPSDVSLTAAEFFAQCRTTDNIDWPVILNASEDSSSSKSNSERNDHRDVSSSSSDNIPAVTNYSPPPILTIIVVDAVWRHARKMTKHLSLLLPDVTRVQLSPEQFSVYARKQTQPDRICTIEALALFLSHCGERQEECDRLIACVKINNAALKRKNKDVIVDDDNKA